MDESSLIFIIVPIAIPIALFTGIARTFIAASRSGRSHARGQPAGTHELKWINAAGRKGRPPKPGAHDAAPSNTCTFPAPASGTTATRPGRAAGSRRCRLSRRRQS